MFRIFVAVTLAAILVLLGVLGIVWAKEQQGTPRTTPAFDQFKALEGEWTGKDATGRAGTVTYKLISNGSVLMEQLQPQNEPEMVTMYTLDGDHIVAQHYCSAGNQPVMQTSSAAKATGKYEFQFVRVTGTQTPDEGHMVALTVTMPDKDHLTQVWTFEDHGKTRKETLAYTRKM